MAVQKNQDGIAVRKPCTDGSYNDLFEIELSNIILITRKNL